MVKWHVVLAGVCLCVGFAAALLLVCGGGPIVSADSHGGCPGEPGTPCGNGDVNADGKIDISDAVSLLNSLFLGGPAPHPIDCPPRCPPEHLSATGQTECYDHLGNRIDCASMEFPGQDGFYKAGCSTEGRFLENGDGTVTDTCTRLMWQQNTAPIGRVNWQAALQYCESLILCEDGTWTTEPAEAQAHGGVKHDDWRLPNVRGLASIVDYGRYNPAINPVFRGYNPEFEWYVTSTTEVDRPDAVWSVAFKEGRIAHGPSGNKYLFGYEGYVRAVRTIEPGE